MPTTVEKFCGEFKGALDSCLANPGKEPPVNWFGRLLAYQYQIKLDGNDLGEEEELRKMLKNHDLKIAIGEIQVTDSTVGGVNDPASVRGTMKITIGKDPEATYEFEHVLKWTLQAKSTTLTKK